MPKVQILPSDVIAKIAAGEVIERPSSVVKECIENALDAGASSIEVHLKDAGKQLIHIKDTGSGISNEDLGNLFQRHATSKIKAIDDLQALHSLGFRGEALFSIGSIADIVLTSQTKENPLGWLLHVRGGERQTLEPAATSSHGTDIKISELFFNVPARRKFLKSNTTEMNQVLQTFIPYTLLYPNVHFKLTNNGRTMVEVKPVNSLKERVALSLNLESKHLLEVDQTFKDDNIRLRMVLGDINIQRTRRDLQYFFINNRPIDHRSLGFHINDIYKLILPPSVYGCFVIYMEIDPSTIDVNIHPTKREVKIEQEGRLISLIRNTVEYTLMSKGGMRTLFEPQRTLEPTVNDSNSVSADQGIEAQQIIYNPGHVQSSLNPARLFERATPLFANQDVFSPEMDKHLFNETPVHSLHEKFSQARHIGSFINKYLLWESGPSLILVDQHAAQERIMFEKFKSQIDEGAVEVQNLLTPIVVKLTPHERIAWEESKQALQQAGLETTAFDDDTVAIQTIPVLIKDAERLLRSLLSGDKAERCDHLTIARRACKASIVTGDRLSPEQAQHQRKQLLMCKDPFICPHGRPTAIEITDNFLEKQFLRS
ncbi:MAG: DNA mismatch repair endonuclease MutL [Candidatus Omnitrophica bacterium]|nr:DNA mismatch repair endonuclease MutL [Candidatus Omnitrophota bacterium]